MKKIIQLLFKSKKYSKWQVLETFYFDASWYIVQVRQNVNTGYKQFKCKKIIRYSYSGLQITVEKINNLCNE